MGSNLKSYKHVYFLGEINYNDKPKKEFQKSEVSDLKWFTLEKCIEHIRNYNVEKIKIIEKIDKTLQRYRLIS
jgi:NADH pyrophosphatase NudC (nudix superfamily)